MTASTCSGLALIVDHDLGFLMWLGEIFTELGWQTVPALQCRQARARARRLNLPIAILLIDPELPGAAPAVKALAASNPGMQVVLLGVPLAHPSPTLVNGRARATPNQANPSGIKARFSLERPSPWETISRADWLAKVRQLLAQGLMK